MAYEIAHAFYAGAQGDKSYSLPQPSMRYMSWKALHEFLRYAQQTRIIVEMDEPTDYWLSPSMTYFDFKPTNDNLLHLTNIGYAIVKRNPSLGYPTENYDGSIEGTDAAGGELASNCFLVFITHIEYNQLNDYARAHYIVDWWDTLLMWNMRPSVDGICSRAHVDDRDIDGLVCSEYFTDEVELPIPHNAVEAMSAPVVREAVIPTQQHAGTIFYLYITLQNTSGLLNIIKNTGNQRAITHDGMSISSNTPAITVCTLIDISNGRLLWTDETIHNEVYISQLTNETILSMSLSLIPPTNDASISWVNDTENRELWRAQIDGVGEANKLSLSGAVPVNRGECIGVVTMDVQVYYHNPTPIMKRISDNAGIEFSFDPKHYWDKTYINPATTDSDYETYLATGIPKSHMYPYTYYSVYRGRTEVTLVSEWFREIDIASIDFYRDHSTDGILMTFETSHGYGKETIYSFEYPTVFAAPFKQSWLERTTSLEAGAFQIAGSAVGIISSAATIAFGGELASAGEAAGKAGQVIAGNYQAAGGTIGFGSNALSLVHNIVAYDRERRATEAGYFIRGTMPSQAFASITGEGMIYIKYTAYTKEYSRELNENLHYFGYHTLVNAHDIINNRNPDTNHRRVAFNYIKTVSCSVRSASLPLDVLSDIKDMFDSGVWLFSQRDITFEVPNPPDFTDNKKEM